MTDELKSGTENEIEFVNYLHNKRFKKLNPLFQELIKALFKNVCDNSLIRCYKNKYQQKSDIFIVIKNEIKGISIKRGSRNSVHVDRITDFIHFLIENKIKKETIINFLKYQYADGTTNGTGLKRLPVSEYKILHQKEIDNINIEFNRKDILEKAIKKFIILGNNSKHEIDALIYGEVNDFLWITSNDIKSIILSKSSNYSTAIHFGPIVCQPKNRCLNFNPKYEKDRFCVQLKWYSLFDDIIEYMNSKQ